MAVVPGIVLCLIVTGAVYALHDALAIAALGPILLAILLGMGVGNAVGLPARAEQGVDFCAKTLLRLTVMLLGAQLTFADLMVLGPWGLCAVVTVILVVLGTARRLGRLMGVPRELTMLIGAGTAICGASAIAATNGVARAKTEQVSYAIAVIIIFGTLGMLCYPLLRPVLGLSAQQYGLWAGLSLHEVAQAVGAGFAEGDVAGKAAVTAKLARVLLLSVVVAALARGVFFSGPSAQDPAPKAAQGRARSAQPLVPWFLAGFLILTVVNSLGLIGAPIHDLLEDLRPVLTVVSMAAIGLGTRLDKLFGLGAKPLLLGGALSLLISLVSLGFAVVIV